GPRRRHAHPTGRAGEDHRRGAGARRAAHAEIHATRHRRRRIYPGHGAGYRSHRRPSGDQVMSNRAAAQQMFNAAVTAANERLQSGHLERAYNLFASATIEDPTWWQAHYQMGCNNADQERYPAAIASWRQALACKITSSEKARVLTNMGWFCYANGQIDEARQYTEEAITLAPKEAAAWCNLSVILPLYDQSEASLHAAQRAFELDSKNIQHEI